MDGGKCPVASSHSDFFLIVVFVARMTSVASRVAFQSFIPSFIVSVSFLSHCERLLQNNG